MSGGKNEEEGRVADSRSQEGGEESPDPSSAMKQLADLANSAGLRAVIEEDGLPVVKIDPTIDNTAAKLGKMMSKVDLFSLNGEIVFFSHDGEIRAMTGTIFRTWITQHVILCEKYNSANKEPISQSLNMQDSATVVAAESFRRGVRELAGINHVRCPVLRPDGKLELLPWGYDEQTRIYTKPGGLEYGTDVSFESAKARFHRAFHQFPITDERSMAVQIAAMLALYVRHLPGGMSLRPGLIWYANKQGSGKSVLCKAAIYPVLGYAAAAKLKRDEDLDKEVEAFCRAKVPYIFLDNVRGGLNSPTLEQMLTSKKSTGRAMGGHSLFTTDNTALLLVSANQVEFNEDMRRRFLLIDLFEEGNPEERVIDTELDDDIMESEAWRAEMLEAMWALVKHWHEQGMPRGSVVMPSFERFGALLGGIVEAAGYHAPFERWVLPDAKAPSREDFHELLALVMEEMGLETERNYTLNDLCRLARAGQLYQRDVGTQEEGKKMTIKEDGIAKEQRALAEDRGYMDKAQLSAFGKRITKEIGTKPVVNGKQIEFGKRAQSRKAIYTVKILG